MLRALAVSGRRGGVPPSKETEVADEKKAKRAAQAVDAAKRAAARDKDRADATKRQIGKRVAVYIEAAGVLRAWAAARGYTLSTLAAELGCAPASVHYAANRGCAPGVSAYPGGGMRSLVTIETLAAVTREPVERVAEDLAPLVRVWQARVKHPDAPMVAWASTEAFAHPKREARARMVARGLRLADLVGYDHGAKASAARALVIILHRLSRMCASGGYRLPGEDGTAMLSTDIETALGFAPGALAEGGAQ
jgi:hypothetical protein